MPSKGLMSWLSASLPPTPMGDLALGEIITFQIRMPAKLDDPCQRGSWFRDSCYSKQMCHHSNTVTFL